MRKKTKSMTLNHSRFRYAKTHSLCFIGERRRPMACNSWHAHRCATHTKISRPPTTRAHNPRKRVLALVVLAVVAGLIAIRPNKCLARPITQQDDAQNNTAARLQELEEQNARLRADNERLKRLLKSRADDKDHKGEQDDSPDPNHFSSATSIIETVPEAILPEKPRRAKAVNYSDIHKERLKGHFLGLGKRHLTVHLKLKVAALPEKSINKNRPGYTVECEVPEGRVIGTDQRSYLPHAGVLWHLGVTAFFPPSHEDRLLGLRVGEVIEVSGAVASIGYTLGVAEPEASPVPHHDLHMTIEIPPLADQVE